MRHIYQIEAGGAHCYAIACSTAGALNCGEVKDYFADEDERICAQMHEDAQVKIIFDGDLTIYHTVKEWLAIYHRENNRIIAQSEY